MSCVCFLSVTPAVFTEHLPVTTPKTGCGLDLGDPSKAHVLEISAPIGTLLCSVSVTLPHVLPTWAES